jgi:lysophospholipase L1-like esterase
VSGELSKRYVALGDSTTEGLCDPAPRQSGLRSASEWFGWADRLAVILDGHARLGGSPFEFANLAGRSGRIDDVLETQIPEAIVRRADLVSVMVGEEDLLDPGSDPDGLAARLAAGVGELRGSGATVLLANCFDPQVAEFLSPFRGRAAAFNGNIWEIARQTGSHVLDVWGIREFQQSSMWADDRTHLSTMGHRLLAARAAHVLGIPYAEIAARTALSVQPTGAHPAGVRAPQ